MKAKTRIRCSIRAISPVISVLLMIAIAVAASLIAYAWMMGYIGGTTTKVGRAILIQSMAPAEDGNLLVYVQNVGQGSVTINSVYVDDVLRSFTPDPNFADNKLPEGKTASLKVDYVVPDSGQVKVKVVTTEGTFTESTAISSGQGSSGSLNIIPTAAFSFSPTDPATGEPVTFTDASTDSDGSVVAWAWAFGDGGTSTLQNPTYSYASANPYTVRLTVTDDDGATNYVEHVVPVGNPPAVLDHFEFDTVGDQQATVAFGITVTAKDQYGTTFNYNGAGTLSDLSGTISPTDVTFSGGVATRSVTISTTYTNDQITVNADGKSGQSNQFNVASAPAVLDHFDFDPISTPQTAGTPFSITIKAKDQYDAAFTSYTGTNTLTYAPGSISPTTTTGGFTAGVWTGSVTLTGTGTGVTIGTTGDTKTGTSNTFNVNAPALPAIYVTSNDVVHDNPNIGTLSDFANMQNDAVSYATLTEGNTGGVETWVTPTGDSGSDWSNRGNARDGNTGTYSYDDFGIYTWSGYLTLSYPSTTGTRLRYWVNIEDTRINNMEIDVYNTATSSWQNVFSGAPTTGAWVNVTFTSRTTNQMRIRFYDNYWSYRTAYVYEMQILSVAPANYQLDSEVQFSGTTDLTPCTQLEIKTGAFSGESVEVQRWSGSAWVSIGTLAQNTVNTYTVSLTGTTFDLRFYDVTRTSDTTQDTWQIDYVRLVAP